MASIADKITYLAESIRLLKETIKEKGIDVPDGTPFRDYADLAGNIRVAEENLWAYLDRSTLYLVRADDFTQHGTTLEVKYDVR